MKPAGQEKYSCQTPGCKATGQADQMWTLHKRATGGKLVIVCGPCGKLARREKVRTFNLSDTLQYEREQAAKRGFFKPFATVFSKENNGNGQKPKLQAVR